MTKSIGKDQLPAPYEHQEQVAVFQWAEYSVKMWPCLEFMYAVINGARVSPKQANKLKAEGMKSGVPDIMLPFPSSGYHGLYIELKRVKGGTASENQIKWIKYLNSVGYLAVICEGADQAIQMLKDYLNGKVHAASH